MPLSHIYWPHHAAPAAAVMPLLIIDDFPDLLAQEAAIIGEAAMQVCNIEHGQCLLPTLS